jgi:ParB family chromosome partitioning protein
MLQTEMVREIDAHRILPSKFKLRALNEVAILELMKSIKANGLLHPIIVRTERDDFYRIVAGSHRLEALKRLGSTNIPAFVKQVSDEEGFLINVTENLQRNTHMNPISEARGYRHLMSKGWTLHDISMKIGKSDSYVCNRLRLLDRLHPALQKELEFPRGKSRFSVSHAEHLASLRDFTTQLELATLIRRNRLSVRQIERLSGEGRVSKDGCLCLKCPNYPKACHKP